MRSDSKVRILLVEDDLEICEILQFYLLTNSDYELTIAHSAKQALPLVQNCSFQLILLDIMLPGADGLQLCEELRKISFCPIIFISCINDDKTVIRALELGGDDYLTKPFEAAVLHARIKANLRRSRPEQEQASEPSEPKKLVHGELTLIPSQQKALKNGEELSLSPTEYALLAYLMSRPGVYLSFDALYKAIWQRASFGDYRALFVHITHLRQKIEDDPARPLYIRTHMRSGYIFGLE